MKNKKSYSPEYISYVENGESAAVFITRDIAKDVPTNGMWVDIVDSDQKGRKDGRWDFNYFIAELFPRKTKPVYPEHASEDEKKYITWLTAHEDIEKHRSNGYHGVKYKICPKLVNRNAGKFNIKKVVWNLRFDQQVPDEWFGSSCEWREIKEPLKPKWEYEIVSVKKI